jgi:hypothetical protein
MLSIIIGSVALWVVLFSLFCCGCAANMIPVKDGFIMSAVLATIFTAILLLGYLGFAKIAGTIFIAFVILYVVFTWGS